MSFKNGIKSVADYAITGGLYAGASVVIHKEALDNHLAFEGLQSAGAEAVADMASSKVRGMIPGGLSAKQMNPLLSGVVLAGANQLTHLDYKSPMMIFFTQVGASYVGDLLKDPVARML